MPYVCRSRLGINGVVTIMSRKFETALRRKGLREKAVAHLGGKCLICGYDKCVEGFDFHHVDPMGKDFTISNRMTSWERIRPELSKCVLLCCRCHREVHAGWHVGFLAEPHQSVPLTGAVSVQLLLVR